MLTFLYSTNSVKMFLYYSEIAFGKLLQRIFIWENVISPSSPHTQGEKRKSYSNSRGSPGRRVQQLKMVALAILREGSP